MLSSMRKNVKKLSWTLWAVIFSFLGTIGLVWGAGGKGCSSGRFPVVINGKPVTVDEIDSAYNSLYANLKQMYGDNLDEKLLKNLNLRKRTIDNVVNRHLMLDKAEELGLVVSEREIRNKILTYKPFLNEAGQFDLQRYQRALSVNRISPESFEAGLRQDLIVERLNNLVETTVVVTPEEIQKEYLNRQEKVECDYVILKFQDFSSKTKPTEEDYKTYFEAHKEDLSIPDRVRLEYVQISPQTFQAKVNISEDEIRENYENNLDLYKKPKEVKASHILFKIPDKAAEEVKAAIKLKALEILDKIKNGAIFAEMAKEYSGDATASKGGDLGYFTKDKMVPEFSEKAFSMAVDEISDLVETRYGFHIIKVTDIRPESTRTLEESKDHIRRKLAITEAQRLAEEAASEISEKAFADGILEQIAQENNLTVEKSELFGANDNLPILGPAEPFFQEASKMDLNDISGTVESKPNYYVFKLIEKVPAHLPEYTEVSEEIQKAVADEQGRQLCLQKADELAQKLTELASGSSAGNIWENFLKSEKLESTSTGLFGRQGFIPSIGQSDELAHQAFSKEVGSFGGPIEVPNGYIIYKVTKKEEINLEALEKEKDTLTQQIRQGKARKIITNWIQDLREQAKIEIIDRRFL